LTLATTQAFAPGYFVIAIVRPKIPPLTDFPPINIKMENNNSLPGMPLNYELSAGELEPFQEYYADSYPISQASIFQHDTA